MVIGEITAEKPFEMALVEDDSVIRTPPADAANDALCIGILPRAPRCDGTFFHTQTAHALSKVISIDSIAISPATCLEPRDNIIRTLVWRKHRIEDLLDRSVSRDQG